MAENQASDLRTFYHSFTDNVTNISDFVLEIVEFVLEQSSQILRQRKLTRSLQNLEAIGQSIKSQVYLHSSNSANKLQGSLELLIPVCQSLAIGRPKSS